MSGKNGSRVSDSMKKQLCEIVDMKFAMKKEKRERENSNIMDVALEHAKKKLGYAVAMKKIQQARGKIGMIEDEIKMMERELNKLGFDDNGKLMTTYDAKVRQYLPVASIAHKMIEGKISETTEDLYKQKIDYKYRMMLAESAGEAKKIMEEIKV